MWRKIDVEIKITYKNDRLKALRGASGLSQSQLAQKTGVSLRTLQHYEQGTKNLNGAHLDTLLKLCIALDCSLNALITDPGTLELLRTYNRKERGQTS